MLNYYRKKCTEQPRGENNMTNKRLAQAYVPTQPYEDLYTPEQAIKAGTVFAQLDMPYKKK